MASETAQCQSECRGLTDDQRTAIANCDTPSCSSALTCLGVDCFNDDDCADTSLETECLKGGVNSRKPVEWASEAMSPSANRIV